MNEEPFKMMTQEGVTINGKHYESIMALFASYNTQDVFAPSTKNPNYSFCRKFSQSEKKAIRKKNKLERQRKKKGRK